MGNERKIKWELVWESVGLKGAPTTVILPENISQKECIQNFLDDYEGEFETGKILPICIECQAKDAIGYWKAMASAVTDGAVGVFGSDENKKRIIRQKSDQIQQFDNSEGIKNGVVWMLERMKREGKQVMLIFSDFDGVVALFDEFDSMKWRELTGHAIILTFSHKSLLELGQTKYANTYFCNQFEDPICIEDPNYI